MTTDKILRVQSKQKQIHFHRCYVCRKLLREGYFTLWINYPKLARRFHLNCAGKKRKHV